MSAAQIRFATLWRREVNRFMKIKKQTLGAPLLETFLYISVFGAALGSRIKQSARDRLRPLRDPRPDHDGLLDQLLLQQLLLDPPAEIPGGDPGPALLARLADGAAARLQPRRLRARPDGLAARLHRLASLLVGLPVDHVLVLIPSLFLVGFFFSQLGVLIGVRAEQFDDVAFAQTFVLQPLIFLGGVFYSAALLPQPFQTLTRFNPIFYMINLVRYGFVGFTEVSIALSLLALTAATAALFFLNLRLFTTGYRLRA